MFNYFQRFWSDFYFWYSTNWGKNKHVASNHEPRV